MMTQQQQRALRALWIVTAAAGLLVGSAWAQARSTAWVVEETSGTIRLAPTAQAAKAELLTAPPRRALTPGMRLLVTPKAAVTVFDGRRRLRLLDDGGRTRSITVPSAPPAGSPLGRLMNAVLSESRPQTARAGILVRTGKKPAAFAAPSDARFIGRLSAVEVDVVETRSGQDLTLVVHRAEKGRDQEVHRTTLPFTKGLRRVPLPVTLPPAGEAGYSLLLSVAGNDLERLTVRPATAEEQVAYSKDREALLAGEGKPDPEALALLRTLHGLLPE